MASSLRLKSRDRLCQECPEDKLHTHTQPHHTTPPTLPDSSAVSTNLFQLGQYLGEDLGGVRDGTWNQSYVRDGILPKEQQHLG